MPGLIRLFISIFILLFSNVLAAQEKPYIISGYDDVLRQAENTSALNAALKLLVADKSFSGMAELYQVIAADEPFPNFTVVSGTSSWFDKRIDSFLVRSKYPKNRRYLRNWLIEWSTENFKIEKIRMIVNERPNKSFIIVFDNSSTSLALVDKINAQFSGQVKSIYLRQVGNNKIPASAVAFYTAFDIAFNEFKAGRLTADEVSKVSVAVLAEKKAELLIPSYAACPEYSDICDTTDAKVSNMCEKVRKHLVDLVKTVNCK